MMSTEEGQMIQSILYQLCKSGGWKARTQENYTATLRTFANHFDKLHSVKHRNEKFHI